MEATLGTLVQSFETIEIRGSDRPTPRRFLSMMPFVYAASTTTSAPKIQVITHLVCKTLRPEYTNRSGTVPLTAFFVDNEETKLCNADPVVQAASAQFLACECPTTYSIWAPEDDPSFWKVITTTTGVLSCLTTAYWGSVSLPATWSIPAANIGATTGSSARIARAASTP